MKSQRKRLVYLMTLLVISLTIVWSTGLFSKSQRDFYDAVSRNLKIFGRVYKETANNYVQDIDPQKFMRAGINGMLDELDPYSVYLEQEAQDDIEIMTRGKYYGVGMRISKRDGWPTVAEQPFPNSPSEKVGIREGDVIIEIDGNSTKSMSLSKTAAALRGKEKGSTVVIKIRRIGVDESMTFSLIRDEIIVSDIQFSGFVEPGIGLIKLNVFNRGAEKQLMNAIENLMDRGMDALILDLRSNPGGLLDVAVSVAGNFLPKGELVVYTQGRTPSNSKEYRTTENPLFSSLPLVVLVDEYSASASEIVAGALQDLDRGVIIGESTFGKGLVQTVLPIDRSSAGEVTLKLTTAKYYLPSGRLIQKPDVFKTGRNSVFWSDDTNDVEDEEDNQEFELEKEEGDDGHSQNPNKTEEQEKKYVTKNGRQVNGGGGIKPDIEVKNENTTRYVAELIRKSMFFNFSLEYAAKHPELKKDFQVTDEMIKEFYAFTQDKQFDYDPAGMRELKQIEKLSKQEGFENQIAATMVQLRKEFEDVKTLERNKSIDDVRYLLKRELAAKVLAADEAYKTSFERDQVLQKAVSVIKDKAQYNAALAATAR